MHRRIRNLLCRGILIISVFLLIFFIFRLKYRDALAELARTQVTNATSDLINDAIDSQMLNNNIQYDRIVYFEKDLEGRITALKTNMSEVNRLKTAILNLINDEILAMDTSELGIPIGNFLFPEIFSGKGPSIPIRILSIRNSDASFHSAFSEAGINQTLQKLNMDIQVDVSVLVLGQINSFTVSSQVVVAETIIVGQVPEMFFQNGGTYEP
jgi:sporulation protein YunB